MKLGYLTLKNALIQAPLAGISCAPFRVIAHKYGSPAYCMTEMISATDLVSHKKTLKRYTYKDPNEGLLCYQLSGATPETLGEATQIVTDLGADLVDLNCGCPMPKIRSKGCGSRLPEEIDKFAKCISAIRENTSLPISVKIRITDFETDKAVANVIEDCGADFMIVHGRSHQQRYEHPCDYESIANIVSSTNLPVIGNGDIAEKKSLVKMMEQTDCQGMMIARASVGQPWIFNLLSEEPSASTPPSNKIIGSILLEHVEGLIALEGEFISLRQARKFAKYYARTINDREEFIKEMNACETFAQLQNLVDQYFTS